MYVILYPPLVHFKSDVESELIFSYYEADTDNFESNIEAILILRFYKTIII